MAQRIVRAKRTLAGARVGFESPGAEELAPRLASVLTVVYLLFNEGYSATAGEDLLRPALCAEAMRLGRMVVALMPDEPEVHGLLALMELQASRLRARSGPDGVIVTLLDQDRSRWDQLLIHSGLAGLSRAEQLGGAAEPYALQAAIAAVHARATTADGSSSAPPDSQPTSASVICCSRRRRNVHELRHPPERLVAPTMDPAAPPHADR